FLGNNVIRRLIIRGSFEGTVAIIPRVVLNYICKMVFSSQETIVCSTPLLCRLSTKVKNKHWNTLVSICIHMSSLTANYMLPSLEFAQYVAFA
ncbi:hypothetical protein LINGRAHAP2_LOCUS31765, partial [Linum grandiflorum]